MKFGGQDDYLTLVTLYAYGLAQIPICFTARLGHKMPNLRRLFSLSSCLLVSYLHMWALGS